jgi:hypothetical protein
MARWGIVMAGAGAMMIAGTASAAGQDAAGERVLQSFAQCRTQADPAQRLACFDSAAAALEQAVKAKDVRIVDRTDVRKARRSLFGFTLPRIDLFGEPDEKDQKEDFAEVNTTVASTRSLANNRVEIRLGDESGAVWVTTDPMPFPPKQGEAIRIRKGVMGNYFLAVDGKTYRGMRVR